MEQDRRQILPYHLQWFAKDGPGGEKTEPATAKKLREAREDGKVAKSKELTAAFDLIVMFLMLKIFVSTIGDGFLQIFYYVYNLIPDFIGINAMDVSTYAVMSFFSPAVSYTHLDVYKRQDRYPDRIDPDAQGYE